MRLLLIEDDDFLRETLRCHLSASGFIVDATDNGENGSYTARTNKYDLIISDNMLPHKNGEEICRDLRTAGNHTPVLILSVVDDPSEKVRLLGSGADDYMTKPFVFAELIARIQTIARRPYTIKEEVLTLDDLTVNTAMQLVEKDGQRIYLTKKEYLLLECMAKKPGRVVTRGEIYEDVWNNDADPFSNTIEAHIRNLRVKLDKGQRKYIHTVPGRGYKLDRSR